jgi:single-stranded-DNA-specific exonuclease
MEGKKRRSNSLHLKCSVISGLLGGMHAPSTPAMKYRWSLAPAQPALACALANELGLSPLLAQCLLNRGLSEPDTAMRFLEPRLKHLADPFLLPNMRAAVERLFRAREGRELVVIFGDYDVDGVTATALLTEVLRGLGWQVDFYLPHRMDEGYGLSRSAVENCLKKFPAKLLLAVDCGSTAVESIDWLNEQGIDVIVLDHHQVSSPAPKAVALVNPQLATLPVSFASNGEAGAVRASAAEAMSREQVRKGTGIFHELCSAGLAFKLAHALVKQGRQNGLAGAAEFDLRPLLDLVALGTIADLVPLTGENRVLVASGLHRLNQTVRPGLVALKEVAQISTRITGYEVGFQLAPRLNAAGRLENALEALRLLVATDSKQALELARLLDTQNRERQQIERAIADEVIGAVRATFKPDRDFVIVEGQLLWHIGVVGIVASKVLQTFYRPTIILGGDAQEWRGSGRSIEGFDLAAALRDCDGLLLRHGGHAMAAGLTIHPDKVGEFRQRINEAARQSLKPEHLQPALRLDAEVAPGEITIEQMMQLERLQQTGMGNPPVHLMMRNATLRGPIKRMGPEQKHARLCVNDGVASYQAVIWGAGQGALPEGRFDLAFVPQINEFKGNRSIQLKTLDWRPAS